MKVLVAGCGSIGQRHIRNLQNLGQDVVAWDTDIPTREKVARELNIPIRNPHDGISVDAVVIATPPDSHLHYMAWAIEQGYPMFVEKPLSWDLHGLELVLSQAKKQNLPILVGYNLRWHWGLQMVRQLLPSLGKPISARAEFGQYLPNWHPTQDYRKGYTSKLGIILDGSHEIDYMRWLMGEVSRVFCLAGHLSQLEVNCEDTAEILMEFESGAFGSIHLDFIQREYSRFLKIVCEDGIITWEPEKVGYYLHGDWKEVSGEWGISETYVMEMKHFLSCIQGSSQPLSSGEDVLKTLKVAIAAKESAHMGGALKLW